VPGFRHIRKTGYKIFDRYKEHGLAALSDRSRRPVRYANQLPQQVESLIVRLKAEKPHWGAARSASFWSGGSTARSGFRPKAPSMRFLTVTAWSNAAAGRATARAARRCRKAAPQRAVVLRRYCRPWFGVTGMGRSI
jgi:hypothetical protein